MKLAHLQSKYHKIILSLFLLILLVGCSKSSNELGILSTRNSWLAENINSFGDFLKTFFVIQLSILIVALFLSFFFKKTGYYVSVILHFIWVLWFKDYGFLNVLLLFGLPIILNIAFSFFVLKAKTK